MRYDCCDTDTTTATALALYESPTLTHDDKFLTSTTTIMGKIQIPPTLNAPWVLTTAICIWFLFIHAPVVLVARYAHHLRPLLKVHLIGAYSVYLTCVHNALLTPSALGGAARNFHIWIGRVGLVLGVIGFVSGFYMVWFEHFDDTQDSDMGFKIGITIGGFSQMQAQIVGIRAIKLFQKTKARLQAGEYATPEEKRELEDAQDHHLIMHVANMASLFAMACGIPALIRITETIGQAYLVPLIALAYGLGLGMIWPIRKKIKAKRMAKRGEGPSAGQPLTVLT